MAVTQRRLVDNFIGSLKNGCTALDTSLVADAFANLPSDFTTTKALPLVIADDSQGLYEVVLVTGHNAGTNTVTAVRGAQGTTARAWTTGAIVRVAVTSRDLTQSMTAASATALGDTHVGMEIADENGILRKQTQAQGFQAVARAVPGGIGAGMISAFTPGSGLELLVQAGYCSANSSSQGYINWNLPAGAFPNALIAVFATPQLGNTENLWHPVFFQSYQSTSSTTVTPNGPTLQFRTINYNNTGLVNTAVHFSVLALGV